ncbi:UNKNOWN [Stylonychia lemnae]|uniref:Uncharacterized protein n=1 Tax=Stylonychia lemnae TaxID=5949 RepID=A0A078B5Y6_STYLE|nr:UNKNOWN [Stylonychia lemnae]|eukprot:CDW88908.1 UNKNOWN [Stylonychia lemnae]
MALIHFVSLTQNENNVQGIKLEAAAIKKRPKQRSHSRDIVNSFPAGFIEGFTRFSTFGKPDCTEQGMQLFRYLKQLETAFERTNNEDDQKNMMQVYFDLQLKCNYISSFEGVVVNKLLRDQIMKQEWMKYGLRQFLTDAMIVVELFINFFDDFLASQMTITAAQVHEDPFNFGVILGKIAKDIAIYFLQGWHEYFME